MVDEAATLPDDIESLRRLVRELFAERRLACEALARPASHTTSSPSVTSSRATHAMKPSAMRQ